MYFTSEITAIAQQGSYKHTNQSLIKNYQMYEPVTVPSPRNLKIFPVFKLSCPGMEDGCSSPPSPLLPLSYCMVQEMVPGKGLYPL